MSIQVANHEVRRASWSSVLAGVATVFAVSILLSLLGTAIGFGIIDPESSDPVKGLGTAFTLWSAVSLIVSLAAGGYVAGRLAGRSGFIHGFLSWASALLLAVILSSLALGSAVKATGSAIGSVFSAVGSVTVTTGAAAGKGVANVADLLADHLDIDLDGLPEGNKIGREVLDAFKDSDVASLQPDYLKSQLAEAKSDVEKALKKVARHPSEIDSIAAQLLKDLKARGESIGEDVDRDAAVKVLAEKTNLSQAEAERSVDELISAYQSSRKVVLEKLDQLDKGIQDAKVQLEELKAKAREQAAEASRIVAKSALWGFFALAIAALVSAYAGLLGSRSRRDDDHPLA